MLLYMYRGRGFDDYTCKFHVLVVKIIDVLKLSDWCIIYRTKKCTEMKFSCDRVDI